MRIKLLTSLAGPDVDHSYGDVVDTEDGKTKITGEAAQRMVDLGYAELHTGKIEKAAKMVAGAPAALPPGVETR